MGTAITWLIAFFIVITTAFAAINGVMSTGASRAEAYAATDQLLIDDVESSFKLVSARQSAGHTLINLIITNDGRTSFTNFEDWVVTVRYDQKGGADEIFLVPPYTNSLSDNTWTAQEFWLDYDQDDPEVIEPGVLNPHEEMEVRIQINPNLEHRTWIVLTMTSPWGVTDTLTFKD